MGLTSCPHCRKLCFTDAALCPSCRRAFRNGELQAQADAEDRAFMRKSYALFLMALLASLGVAAFVVLRAYRL